MANFVINQILVANGDEGGWMQLLIIIIIAAFYGISTLLKAKSAIKEQRAKQQRKPSGPKPRPQPPQSRPMEGPFDLESLRKAFTQPRKITIKKPPQPVVAPAEIELTEPEPELELIIEKPPKPPTPPAEPAIAQQLFDYPDPADLQKAILYYEILGKPISLRKP